MLAHALLPPYGLIHFDADEKWAAMIINELSRLSLIFFTLTFFQEEAN